MIRQQVLTKWNFYKYLFFFIINTINRYKLRCDVTLFQTIFKWIKVDAKWTSQLTPLYWTFDSWIFFNNIHIFLTNSFFFKSDWFMDTSEPAVGLSRCVPCRHSKVYTVIWYATTLIYYITKAISNLSIRWNNDGTWQRCYFAPLEVELLNSTRI